MKGASAWVLSINEVINVAVGQFEIAHIVDQTNLTPIAQAPEHCRFVTVWNNKIVPIFNIAHWISTDKPVEKQPAHFNIIAILIYKLENGNLAYGGIPLNRPPTLTQISNNQQCGLPAYTDKWKSIAISCFRSTSDQAIPILNTQALFQNRLPL
ncbi:hypothetical protein MNBD_GAMMA11-53 [hydrothermal vent metagenome]|uniref:CheW-like domain-containing protein n=1 Tax=hydrothermal vent metagenome TaxID=652676 RepID=A0A3B0WVF2_9ZZZZ